MIVMSAEAIAVARRAHELDRRFQQLARRGVGELRVGVGKVAPEVTEIRGAEQGVTERVGRDVGVGVSDEAARVGDLARDPARVRG